MIYTSYTIQRRWYLYKYFFTTYSIQKLLYSSHRSLSLFCDFVIHLIRIPSQIMPPTMTTRSLAFCPSLGPRLYCAFDVLGSRSF